MMSLPASQQRALNQIEKILADNHPWAQRLNGADLNKKIPVQHCALYFPGCSRRYLKW
jgi:hypothetical protein